jgi:ubiquinone/menaquinone biosynthesis C-methylase UbiE
MEKNLNEFVVQGFGDEWSKFDQSPLSQKEISEVFDSYFSIFPWDKISDQSVGFDLGCGSGRWAKLFAPRVKTLHCIDPSIDALSVAKNNLIDHENCVFHNHGVDSIPLDDDSVDFGYSLGVLHHVPDTAMGIKSCVRKLKKGSPFLVYLYYSFDNKPSWYGAVWKSTEFFRKITSRFPFSLKYFVSQLIAVFVYWPFAKAAFVAEKIGFDPSNMILSAYRHRSFYVLRTDALDRFGTQLEQRFSKEQILQMMESAGLENVQFNTSIPYWCAVGFKK